MWRNWLGLLMGSAGALSLSAAARALPAPRRLGSRCYRWFFRGAHFVLGNFDKVTHDVQSGGR